MMKSQEFPDCIYQNPPILIKPNKPTPNHTLYLSNLDDQKFLRFSIKYLYLFKKSVNMENLKQSLSSILVDYYPLAGRLRNSCLSNKNDDCECDDKKLEICCNGEGALFCEAFMDFSVDEFLEFEFCCKPNRSWRKLLFKVDSTNFLDIPPLVIQVTNLRCGGMFLCTAINHCLCDGIGTSQFLQAWARLNANLNHVPIVPIHARHMLKPRNPLQPPFHHPGFTKPTSNTCPQQSSLGQFFQSQRLVPISLTFTTSHILHLKRQCIPSMKCTTFEALAFHTWRSWVRALNLSSELNVKLLFSINVRKKLNPEIPQGFYGNGFVLGCAETTAKQVVDANMHRGVKLIQQAKSSLTDDYVKSIIDLLEDKSVKTDLNASLVISQWSKLGLEELDFGEGKPLHMGPLTSDIYCLFLPVIGDFDAVRVLVSMPESVAGKLEYYMRDHSYLRDDQEHDQYDFNTECHLV